MNEIFIHALATFVVAPLALLKVYLQSRQIKDMKRRLGR